MSKINKILSKKIKSPLSLRGTFPFCHSRESVKPSSLSLRGALSPVIARERSDRSNLNLSGFSLIELMVAVAILAMAIFGIFHAYSVGFMGMADARDRTIAVNYAREIMERIRNDSSLLTGIDPYDEGKFHIDININGPNGENLYNITTTVSWTDRNGNPKEVKLDTFIYNND